MENLTNEFERRVTAFLRRSRLSPSEFGERAVGDRKFVGDVRRGRSPRLATADRVLAFMAEWERAHVRESSAGDRSVASGPGTSGRKDTIQ